MGFFMFETTETTKLLVIVPHAMAPPSEPVALRHVDNSTLDGPTLRNEQRSLPGVQPWFQRLGCLTTVVSTLVVGRTKQLGKQKGRG